MQLLPINIYTPIYKFDISSNKNFSDNKTKDKSFITKPVQFAYRDFNISFGERLFRSPENFYEQPFNQKGMPKTMKDYLYRDYEDRQKMPPNQMLKLVFDDLNYIDNLDYVKKHFSGEPLFANLSNSPNRNAKKGLVSEVEAMKSEMDDLPLFKDGNSNLGVYLLRKIYLEGKTLKEIQKDFKKDLSSAYDGLITSNVEYDTLSAYGIKFPNNAFWKSFTATREDFPYVYKPRKVEGSTLGGAKRERTLSDIMSGNIENTRPARPPKFRIKDAHEGERFGDAILKGHGSKSETEKALRSKGITDKEELSFVSKYLGQIMSVALEKTHASDEMRNFFQNYDNLNKKQREKLSAYWSSNQQMRELQSLAITDTIKLFFEAYGADGNNDEFQSLLKYADSIKPEREARLAEHDRIQREYYDTLAEELNNVSVDEAQSQTPIIEKRKLTKEETEALLEAQAIKNGAEIFSFISPSGEHFKYVGNRDEMFESKIKYEYRYMPTPLVSKFHTFVRRSPLATDDYIKTVSLIDYAPDFVLKQLMPIDDVRQISIEINKAFDEKYKIYMAAGEQAILSRIIAHLDDKNPDPKLVKLMAVDFCNIAHNTLKIENWSDEDRKIIEQDYQEYIKPIKNNREANQICEATVASLSSINPDSKDWVSLNVSDDIHKLLAANLREYPNSLNSDLKKALRKTGFIDAYGGNARFMLKEDIPMSIKNAKAKLMFEDMIAFNPNAAISFLVIDRNNILKYIKNPQLKLSLLEHNRVLQHSIY